MINPEYTEYKLEETEPCTRGLASWLLDSWSNLSPHQLPAAGAIGRCHYKAIDVTCLLLCHGESLTLPRFSALVPQPHQQALGSLCC